MKRLAILVLLTLALVFSTPALGVSAQPVVEEWGYFSAGNGSARVSMNINTTNLKADQFNIYNNSEDYVYFAIVDTSSGFWVVEQDIVVAPNTSDTLLVNLNFKRLPATDPDDPSSIRMPKDTVFWMQFPTDYR